MITSSIQETPGNRSHMSPGHRTEEPRPGTQDAGARPGSGGPSIPRCGVSSPFRGHLSTKSNAFCIGRSSRLSDQYRVRDHMLIHYNKILSAKAAIDCSVPQSMVKSIKYSDQQRRERMKKEVARLERTSSHSAASSRPHSRDSADSVMHRKDPYDLHSPLLRHSPFSDPGPMYSPSSFISSPRHLCSPAHTGERHLDLSRMQRGLSASTACSAASKFQDSQTKTYSGDLLEKHSHHFTNKERPFTPRTLKTPAKSALAQSRYYTPPRRKRRGAEAETQTDMSSFQRSLQEKASSPIGDQAENNEYLHLSDEDDDGQQRAFSRLSFSDFKSPSPTLRKIHSEEEELAYLKFVADVTSEILTLGLFSDRVLDRVFHRHLEENRHRLDESKMRHLLDILRADLDHKDDGSLKSLVSSSPWDAVIKDRSKEEEEDFSYLDSLVTGQHRNVDSPPPMDKKDALAGDCTPIGTDQQRHHQEDAAQTDRQDEGDLSPRPSSSLEDRGSPAQDEGDLQLVQDPSEDLLPDVSATDPTVEDTTCSSDSRPPSKKPDDLGSLEDLQQSFSEVVQVSRADDEDDVSDPGEEEDPETSDHNDF